MGKKKFIIIISAVIITLFIIISASSIRHIYFSETEGRVIDLEGNPLKQANVLVHYACNIPSLNVGGGEGAKYFYQKEILTDDKGAFSLNSFDAGFVLFLWLHNCDKRFYASKRGYCYPMETETPDFPCGDNSVASANIKAKDTSVTITLKKSAYYNQTI